MRTRINAENIQTVSELINFLKSTNLFCKSGKREAIKFFSEFNGNELIDNIKFIPEIWVFHFCRAIRGETIERFRNRIESSYFAWRWACEFKSKEIELMRNKISDGYHAYLWAYELGGVEIDLMRNKINDEYSALAWACKFKGKEIDLMRNKITSDYFAYLWACELGNGEIDYMLNIVKDENYKNALIELKQELNSDD